MKQRLKINEFNFLSIFSRLNLSKRRNNLAVQFVRNNNKPLILIINLTSLISVNIFSIEPTKRRKIHRVQFVRNNNKRLILLTNH